MARKRSEVEPELLETLGHPLRLRIMGEAAEGFSPKRLSDAFGGISVQLVSYHVRKLREAGLIEIAEMVPRRGAVEHFYRASPDAAARLSALGAALTSLGESLTPTRPKRNTRSR